MHKFLLIFVLLGFTSCSLFESKEEKTQKLVSEQLLQIDWSDVDDYPLFSDCDELAAKPIQKKCFEEKVILHLSKHLQEFELISETEIKEVVFLDFSVESDGNISAVHIENKEIFGSQMKKFENRIAKGLRSLPKIEPALKRGIPVRAKFRIPILLNSK